jgi:hypothetical protein
MAINNGANVVNLPAFVAQQNRLRSQPGLCISIAFQKQL